MKGDDDTMLLEEVIPEWLLGVERAGDVALNIEEGDEALQEIKEDEVKSDREQLLLQQGELEILRVVSLHIL